ncbi:uncharacterized protein BCR38DRAFT_431960 [Pseudomassariella vexata]|uniref:Extracellular membrane protein CFEM domain-containing protein n=1 Tax=Pseudomassariella vexata TaxID=1141098 RepID=A0A1Y2E0S0_9PEZI|nr:uncharacterized protein BCR38DRAFT_431960 [Pseudomassariella vexata]ORY65132.1 hypothetical protein BCR38DRAFT_431960 [Pseudomassariella vexata]
MAERGVFVKILGIIVTLLAVCNTTAAKLTYKLEPCIIESDSPFIPDWTDEAACIHSLLQGARSGMPMQSSCYTNQCFCEPDLIAASKRRLDDKSSSSLMTVLKDLCKPELAIQAASLLDSYCAAFVLDLLSDTDLADSALLPGTPSVVEHGVSDAVDFFDGLCWPNADACLRETLQDMNSFVALLGYASDLDLCHPRGVVPEIVVQQAQSRARQCNSSLAEVRVSIVMDTYCSVRQQQSWDTRNNHTCEFLRLGLSSTGPESLAMSLPLTVWTAPRHHALWISPETHHGYAIPRCIPLAYAIFGSYCSLDRTQGWLLVSILQGAVSTTISGFLEALLFYAVSRWRPPTSEALEPVPSWVQKLLGHSSFLQPVVILGHGWGFVAICQVVKIIVMGCVLWAFDLSGNFIASWLGNSVIHFVALFCCLFYWGRFHMRGTTGLRRRVLRLEEEVHSMREQLQGLEGRAQAVTEQPRVQTEVLQTQNDTDRNETSPRRRHSVV